MTKGPPKIADMNTRLDAIYPPGTDCTSFRLSQTKGPMIRCRAEVAAAASGNQSNARYEVLQLLVTADHRFVAVHNWCSNLDGESDMVRAAEVETVAEAMDLWDWSTIAKNLAKMEGWDVSIWVGERG